MVQIWPGLFTQLFTHKSSRSYLNHLVFCLGSEFVSVIYLFVLWTCLYNAVCLLSIRTDIVCRPGLHIRYSDSLQDRRSGDRIPVGGENFRSCPDQPRGPTSPLYDGYWVSFPRVKRPGRGFDRWPPPSAEVKERVQLYLYSSFGLSWPVIEWTSPLLCSYRLKQRLIYWPRGFRTQNHKRSISGSNTFLLDLTINSVKIWEIPHKHRYLAPFGNGLRQAIRYMALKPVVSQ